MGLSRQEFKSLLAGSMPLIPSLLQEAYQHELWWGWREGGRPQTSFHVREFPGNDPVACGRYAVYNLLDVPRPNPLPPFVQAWMDSGTDVEHRWVTRLAGYGSLVSAAPGDGEQTKLIDEDVWASGNVDAIVLPRGWTKSYVVEVKQTSHEKVLAMLSETPTHIAKHAQYLRQLKTYIGLAHELPYTPTVNICDESGAIISPKDDYVCPHHRKRCAFSTVTLTPPDEGELVYSSREEPLTTAAFRVQYDYEHMAAGRAKLAEWRDYFLRGEIPPHPREAKEYRLSGKMGWSIPPCAHCPLKGSVCRIDHAAKVTRLEDSALIPFAQSIRPAWDYEEKRNATIRRWEAAPEDDDPALPRLISASAT